MIRALAKFPGATGKIANVELLGHSGPLKWTHGADGLAVELPDKKPCNYAVALKLSGEDLRGFKPELAVPAASLDQPDASGSLTSLRGAERIPNSRFRIPDGKSRNPRSRKIGNPKS